MNLTFKGQIHSPTELSAKIAIWLNEPARFCRVILASLKSFSAWIRVPKRVYRCIASIFRRLRMVGESEKVQPEQYYNAGRTHFVASQIQKF